MRGGGAFNGGNDSNNITDSSDTAVTKVGEIWNGTTFYKTNFKELLKYISTDGTLEGIGVSSTKSIKASDIYGYGTDYNNKKANTSLIVTFGGLDWIVTYISQDTSGNPIATLWLASNATTSKWSNGYYEDTGASVEFPSNMYSTSYIRAVSLNNGGTYATSTTASTTASKRSSHTYAKFTMPNGNGVTGSVIDYLVTPSAVSWQKTQSAITQLGFPYNLPNDEWQSSGTGYDSNYDYGASVGACATHYSAWKDDYIWLPSLTETGFDDSNTGLWGTNVNERADTTGSWLRSGHYFDSRVSDVLNSSGSSYYINTLTYSCAVRPALHLNLKSAAQAAVDLHIADGIVELNKTYFEYTGSSVDVSVVSVVNGEETLTEGTDYTISYKTGSTTSTTPPSEIGKHYVVLTGKGEYIGTVHIPFEIVKAKVTIPTITTPWLEYNGAEQTISATYDDGKVTASGLSGTNAGEYTATFTLTDTTHYEWNDGTTTAKTLNWLIAKKVIPKPTVKSSVKFTYTGYEQEILPEHLDNWIEGVMVITGGNKFTNVGKYTLQVALTTEGAKNYVWRE